MAIRKIFNSEQEVLSKVCKSIKDINMRMKILAEDLADTVIAAGGVGLAAPQVGVMKRMFVTRPNLEVPEEIFTYINPEIISEEGEQLCTEGCLSVPGYMGIVKRPKKIRIKYQDLEGGWHEDEYEDFNADIICHEYDHLQGIIYTSRADRIMTEEEYVEAMAAIGDGDDLEEIISKKEKGGK